MTQIRVHELASELNASTQQVLGVLEDLGHKVRGPSTVVGVSVAARVRGRLRLSRSGAGTVTAPVRRTEVDAGVVEMTERAPGPVGAQPPSAVHHIPVAAAVTNPVADTQPSLFLPPVAPAAPRTAARSTGTFSSPFAVPMGRTARTPATAPGVRSTAGREPHVPLVIEPEPTPEAVWEARGISAADQARWLDAGLRPSEAGLADRCIATGIAPEELGGKLSGRTALQRLRDGEASTSVWARIREAEQQPRRAGTKLTGRFQLS